ncbi:MAG: class B sortase [Oscillospiraceae bacterium]|nr:class B sortase [Oscillospiraceae bacterium]
MKRKLLLIPIGLLVGVFLLSGWRLGDYMIRSHRQKQLHRELAEIVRADAEAQKELPPHKTVKHPETGEERAVLRKFASLYERNGDLVGWICIPGTKINYPVLQSRVEEYYLRRDFDKTWSHHGSIYAWEKADVFAPSDNVTLFGHQMNDGAMFCDLLDYADAAFWREHPTFRFDTLDGEFAYEIFAVFRTSGTGGEGFAYHTFTDAADAEEFDAFAAECRALSLYDTGIVPRYGDKLVTLSTCDEAIENGRMVVVGRRKKASP